MSIASLVLGIVSVILGFIPFCGWFALLPAIVGLILGSIDLSKLSKTDSPKGMAIAGVVLNIVAVIFIIFWIIVVAGSIASLSV